MKKQAFLLLLTLITLDAVAQKDYNIVQYGAKTGLNQNNAVAIQKAIDAAAGNKGGRVIVPAGVFVTGSIILKSGVELHLADDALLYGSTNRLDYTKTDPSMIRAIGQHDIAITGNGVIDGQGRDLMENMFILLRAGKVQDTQWLLKRPGENNRPYILFLQDCHRIKINYVTLKNAASWVQHYKECEDLTIDHIQVHSTAYWNNDGIDIVDSKNVRITNSFVDAADDAICLKSESADKVCENIAIENCTVRSSASGFKLGTASLGGFRNITVKNLTVYDTYRSAIALEAVDGGFLENVNVQNVTAKNTGNAILLRLGHRNKDERYSSLQHIYIAHVKAEIPSSKPDIGYPMEGPLPKVPPHNLVPASITGLPGHLVKDVVLEDIDLVYGGKSNKNVAFINMESLEKVPENEAGYPEFTMFGELPAWGFYIRHAENIQFNKLKMRFQEDDFRPAMVFDDVKGLKLNEVQIPTVKEVPVLVLNKTADTLLEKIEVPVNLKKAVLKQ